MRKFTRLATPDYLEANWERWGATYEANKLANSGYAFQWPTFKGTKINQLLLPILKLQTQGHCSYCDGFPLGFADDTIDHFKPKSDVRFYKEVCAWPNLYIACADCQKIKWDTFNDLLLRPDDSKYEFNNYFLYNYTNHKIEILPNLSAYLNARAETTIKTFGLNDIFFCKSRQISFERFLGNLALQIDDLGFRFIF